MGDAVELVRAADEGRHLLGQIAGIRVRRSDRWELRREVRRPNLEDPLRSSEIAESVLAQVGEFDAGWQGLAQHLFGRERDEDLPTVRSTHDPRRPVDRRPVVVVGPELGGTGVQPHAHAQRLGKVPGLLLDRSLGLHRGLDATRRVGERRVHTVTGGLHDVSVARLHRGAQDLVVPGERPLHRIWMRLPEPCRSLNVGEEEGDGAAWKVGHDEVSASNSSSVLKA